MMGYESITANMAVCCLRLLILVSLEIYLVRQLDILTRANNPRTRTQQL